MVGIDTLATVDVNVCVTLTAPHLPAAVARRLFEFGLRPGTDVVVVHRTAGGGRVVAVDGARVALDRATLRGIRVGHPRPAVQQTPDERAA